MSFNQSRSDKIDSSNYRKSGRSGSFNNQRNSSGAYGKGGAPAPAVSSSTNRSSKKPSNVQAVQSRANPVAPNPNSTGSATAPPHNVHDNYSSNPQIRGPSNAPLASTVAKPTDATAAPHRGTPIVPKAPTSQSTPMRSDVTAPATPVKASGDAAATFSFQFGSLSPGFVNLQIPARTSSAPPNINEQRQAQARQDAAKIVPPVPVPPVSRLQPQKKDSASAERVNTDDPLIPKVKPDTHQPVPSVVQPQKAHVHPVPVTSMRMNFHQPQVPVHFSGPNPQSQPQVFPASSMPMPVPIHMPLPVPNAPQVQQQMFVQGIQSHPMQHQGIIHQGQGLSFAPQVNPQLPQLGNLGIGIAQYSQQQGGQFSGARKSAVKITHPDTHQEVRLDSRSDAFSDGVPSSRTHPSIPPQSQTISAYPSNHQINYFPSYTPGGLFFPAPSSLPLAGPQINTVSQGSRFGYPVGQSPPTASFMNSQASNSTAPGKVGTSIQGPIEQITKDHLQNIRDATYFSSSAVPRVTVKQAEPGGETNPSSLPNSSAAVSIELPKVLRPSSGHRQRESASAVSSPKQKPDKELPVPELQFEKTEQYAKKLQDSSYGNPVFGKSADVSPEVSPSTVVNSEDNKMENSTGSNSLGDQVKKLSHIDNSQLHLQVEGCGKSLSRVSSSTSCPSSEAVEVLETQANSLATPGINEGVSVSLSEPSQTNVATATSDSEVSDIVEGSRSASSGISEAEIADSAKYDLQVKIAQSIPEVVTEKSEQDAVNSREINSTTDYPEVSASSAESATFSSSSVSPHGDDVSNGTAHDSSRTGNEVVAGSADAEFPEKTTVDGDARESTAVKEGPTQVVASNDKPVPELNRSKTNANKGKKKRREILQKADAAGTTSDLYMAYKGPEGKKAAVVTSESADVSTPIGPNQPHGNALLEEISVNEEVVHSTAEPDDWEDAADISTPKLEDSVSEKQVLPDIDDEDASMTKKYSRDFLMKFAERYTNLPENFAVSSDNAVVLSPWVNMSRSVDRDSHPSPRRGMERQGGGPRLDRRGSNLGEEDRRNKASGAFGPGRDMHVDIGFNNNVGIRPGQGANYGGLRNPRPQSPGQNTGGILSGPAQPPVYQGGIQRNGSDADRWQRAASFHQKGLFPSPQTPHQMMHRAEKKYEIGKVTDEEQAKQRQLKAILNKLTPQNFEKLFEQVLAVNIDNAVTLTGLISQIFDKALMEPTFCEMYANLCAHLSQKLPDLSEDNEKITFKRVLLNKCQEEFERGEREQKEADKVEEEGEVKQSEEQREEKRIKARRRMLGNIRLIGELYKKKMLTEKIMHDCMHKLLLQYQTPHEEDLEALCKLMSTIGEMIDHLKAKDHMDAYFDRMAELSNNMDLSSRVRFMLKDSIDLRKNKWQQRRKVEGPKKIDEVHRDAAQERHAQASRVARSPSMNLSGRRGSQMDFAPRGGSSLSSPSSQIGGYRGLPSQARGYGAQDARYEERQTYEARTLSVPLPQRSMGDDSITLGPQGGLGRGMSVRGTPLSANHSAADVSSAFGDSRRGPAGLNSFTSAERTGYNSREDSSARFTGDRYQGAASDKWNVQGSRDPRSPDYSFDRSGPSSQPAWANGPSHAQYVPLEKVFPEEKLRHSSIEAIKEYYRLKNLEEVVQCIRDLNSPSFYQTMVSVWVNDSFERKDKDRDALTELLIKLSKSQDTMLSQLQLIQGFELVLTTLEDTVTDAPKAVEFLGRMFGKVVVENVVPLSEIGRILHRGGEEPGQLLETGLAADVLESTLEMIKSDKGEAGLKEIRRSSSLRLEDFRDPQVRLDQGYRKVHLGD